MVDDLLLLLHYLGAAALRLGGRLNNHFAHGALAKLVARLLPDLSFWFGHPVVADSVRLAFLS